MTLSLVKKVTHSVLSRAIETPPQVRKCPLAVQEPSSRVAR
ncbi:hypothetical protein JOD54_003942 [Actinokineospora baliensis]|nr:hypothetical protein [Actinokineospora baliensis]MBM7773738.1 hypothetical protein [Actinokineospora baliensis]